MVKEAIGTGETVLAAQEAACKELGVETHEAEFEVLQMPEKKHRTVISSYSQAVVFDKKTIIIGERINPTGKSKFKQALRDHNLEYILREGVTQQDNGADVLDVNVGLPEID